MPRRTTTTPLEEAIRENIRRLIDVNFEGKVGRVSRKHKNVTLSRLQDFLKGKRATIAQLQPWADALGVKPYQLLVKDLNVKDLPEMVPAQRLRRLERMKQLLEEDGDTDR